MSPRLEWDAALAHLRRGEVVEVVETESRIVVWFSLKNGTHFSSRKPSADNVWTKEDLSRAKFDYQDVD